MSGRQECGYDVSITAFYMIIYVKHLKNKTLFIFTDINCVKVKYFILSMYSKK